MPTHTRGAPLPCATRLAVTAVAVAGAVACAPRRTPAQQGQAPDTAGVAAAAAANAQMSSMRGMPTNDTHMYMTELRSPNHADSARADTLVGIIRRDLGRYRDVHVAIADGYVQFLPNVRQLVYHFTNTRYAIEAAFRFNPDHPTSLLYRKHADGTFTLVGVMYTAPRVMSETQLNARVPLSVAQWHQHVNWCVPARGDAAAWKETRDGHPVFGPRSPIATQAACDAVGGRFLPHIFGWMVHVNAFVADPAQIWAHMG